MRALLKPWLACLLVAVAPWPQSAHAARVAMVIGNAAYTDGPLKNPVNDARAVDAKLRTLGFSVQRIENLKRSQIGRTVTAFASSIQPGDEVVVFYAGHGLQVKGVNYLPAVDADIQSEEDVALNSLNLNSLLDRLDEAKAGVKLLFLDACRNNPYARSFRSGARGLARVSDAPSGTLMHFATRPGSVAADGSGSNGLYTTELLKQIDQPGLPVEQVLKRVAAAVERSSQGQQEPWVEGSLKGDFYFKPGAAAPNGASGLDVTDLESADQQNRATQAQWNQWQQAMQVAFDRVDKLGSDALQAKGWERFISSYEGQNNPYSTDDDALLQRARQALSARQRGALQSAAPYPASSNTNAQRPGSSFRDCDACPEMVWLPPGRFRMGSTDKEAGRSKDEGPVHEVVIRYALAVGKYAVTFDEWQACAASGGCKGKPSPHDAGWGRGSRPVIHVSWHDAQEYVRWLSNTTGKRYRLLSEAEWEYAARSNTTTPFYTGMCINNAQANINNVLELAGCAPEDRPSAKKTRNAGSYPPNAFGLHDMAGNVHQWVEDVYHEHYNGAPVDGSAWLTSDDAAKRVLRGGAWNFMASNARSASRHFGDSTTANPAIGLRVATTP
jgi:formylglycine-generating enzyme required for sulfatase activity